jgi:hypothetical protein
MLTWLDIFSRSICKKNDNNGACPQMICKPQAEISFVLFIYPTICSCRRYSNLRQSSHTCEWNYMPLPLCIPASIIIYLCSKPNKVFSSNTDVYWFSFKTRDTGTKVVYQITDLQNICNVMSCHVMAWHGMSCPVMSCHVMSCHVMHVCACMFISI